jgi:hypothetical protein
MMKKTFKFGGDYQAMQDSFKVMRAWQYGNIETDHAIKELCKINKQDLITESQFLDIVSFWGFRRK